MSTNTHPLAATVNQAADFLSVSRWTVNRLIAAETIHSIKIGRARRIPYSELNRLLTENEAATKRDERAA